MVEPVGKTIEERTRELGAYTRFSKGMGKAGGLDVMMKRHCTHADPVNSATPVVLRRRDAQNHVDVKGVPPIVHEVLRSQGQPLDRETRIVMESKFDHDFSKVRVHTDAKAAESARAVNAFAYTVGQDIVFGNGRYAPGTSSGQRRLSHELTHVVQQDQPAGTNTAFCLGSPTSFQEREAETVAKEFPNVLSVPLSVGPKALMRDPDLDEVTLTTSGPLPGDRPPGYPEDLARYTYPRDYDRMLESLVNRCTQNHFNLQSFLEALRIGWGEVLLDTRLEVLTEPAGISLLTTNTVTVLLSVPGFIPQFAEFGGPLAVLALIGSLVFNVVSDAAHRNEIEERRRVLDEGFSMVEPTDPGERGHIARAFTEQSLYQDWMSTQIRPGPRGPGLPEVVLLPTLRFFRIPPEFPRVEEEQVKSVIRREVLSHLVTAEALSPDLPFLVDPNPIAEPGMSDVPFEIRPLPGLGEGIRHLQRGMSITNEFGYSLALAWLRRNGLQSDMRTAAETYDRGFLVAELADTARFRQVQRNVAERLTIPLLRSGPLDNIRLRTEWAWGSHLNARVPINIKIVEVWNTQTGAQLFRRSPLGS